MNTKRIWMRVLTAGVVVVLAPVTVRAQIDPGSASGASGYPTTTTGAAGTAMGPGGATTSPTGINQQNGQTGGAQPMQPSSMRDSLGAPGLTGQEMMDRQFMQKAAEGNIADIRMGTMAEEKGGAAVKELAQKLVDDHTTMEKDLAAEADSMGVMLPKKMSKDAEKEYDKLKGLSGKDFDTEYVTYEARVHFGDLHVYHMEASVAADPGLTSVVVKEMGMMHQHLGLIVSTAKEEGIALPPRPKRAEPTTASK